MRKNIEVVNLDQSSVSWLCNALAAAPPELTSVGELHQGLTRLLSGRSSSLLLEYGDSLPAGSAHQLRCQDLVINTASRQVFLSGTEVSLTPKEYDILYYLASHKGEVFTKEQIYNAVWGTDYLMDDSNVMAFIRKLRKKIEPAPDAPKYIITVWGIGYKFNDALS